MKLFRFDTNHPKHSDIHYLNMDRLKHLWIGERDYGDDNVENHFYITAIFQDEDQELYRCSSYEKAELWLCNFAIWLGTDSPGIFGRRCSDGVWDRIS